MSGTHQPHSVSNFTVLLVKCTIEIKVLSIGLVPEDAAIEAQDTREIVAVVVWASGHSRH